MLKLREKYKVQFDQIDFSSKITMNGISSMMQVIAANHASLLGFNYYKNSDTASYYWILSRVKYVIESYPKWEDEVEMETYPGGYDKLFAVRLFDIYSKNQEKIGYIIGDYVLIDSAKMRPVSLKGQQGELACLDFPYQGEKLKKLTLPKGISIRQEKRKAYYSEMDLNGHMNNAHYIKWIVDLLPIAIFEEYEIHTLEVNYNTSITYGVEVYTELIKEDICHYTVCGMNEERTIQYFIACIELKAI